MSMFGTSSTQQLGQSGGIFGGLGSTPPPQHHSLQGVYLVRLMAIIIQDRVVGCSGIRQAQEVEVEVVDCLDRRIPIRKIKEVDCSQPQILSSRRAVASLGTTNTQQPPAGDSLVARTPTRNLTVVVVDFSALPTPPLTRANNLALLSIPVVVSSGIQIRTRVPHLHLTTRFWEQGPRQYIWE
jgi:hypothetical protein